MTDMNRGIQKLTEELIDRIDVLEKEKKAFNDNLTKAIQTMKLEKRASCSTSSDHKGVSENVLDATIEALVKTGSITPDQVDESRMILREDPNAAHRVLQSVLYAQSQAKTASAQDTFEVSGGSLTELPAETRGSRAACLDSMYSKLKLI